MSRLRIAIAPVYRILYSFKPQLRDVVVGSGISPSFEKYAEKASIFITGAVIIVFAALSLALYKLLGLLAIVLSAAASLAVILPTGLAIAFQLPITLYRNRGSILEAKFPLFAAILASLLASGATLYVVFRELEHRLDVLKPFELEVKTLNSLIALGYSVEDALLVVARVTPSKSIRETLLGLRPIARIGGDPYRVVASAFERYNDEYKLKVEGIVNTLGILMEAFVAVALLIPVTLVTTAILVAIIPGPFSFETLAFALIMTTSISSIAILIVSDAVISRMRL